MGFEQNGWERQMFAEYYRLAEKFWKPDTSDKYWDLLIEETEKFWNKYDKLTDGYSGMLAMDLGEYLERKYYKENPERYERIRKYLTDKEKQIYENDTI